LQDLLDLKAKQEGCHSRSSIILRWDLKQIFDMAAAEGHIRLNPALLLFTPRKAKRPRRRTLSTEQDQVLFEALAHEKGSSRNSRSSADAPGEIFALTWGRLTATNADIQQHVKIDAEDGQFVLSGRGFGKSAGRN
jgi:hypothetical protein